MLEKQGERSLHRYLMFRLRDNRYYPYARQLHATRGTPTHCNGHFHRGESHTQLHSYVVDISL